MEAVLMRDCVDGRRRSSIANLFDLGAPVQKSAAYTLLETDSGKLFHDLTNAVTFTFPAALNIGWWCVVKHLANTTITLSGSGATLNGAASLAAANTQDPSACALIIKTAADDFSCFLIGTWT